LITNDRSNRPNNQQRLSDRILAYTPQEVTPPALRYTWLVFLLRQGLRAADVAEIAGPVSHHELMASMEIHSPKTKQPAHQIDRVLPILRQLAARDEGRLES